MRVFLVAIAFISSFSLSAVSAANEDDTTQLVQSEPELERLRTLFREIVEQTEARIQQHAESVAASDAEAARLSEELATAQQEFGQLTATLKEAEAAGTEAEARIQQQSEAIADSNTETARLGEELATAQQEIRQLTVTLVDRERSEAEARVAANAEAARLSEKLATARQQMDELKSGLADAQSTFKELDTELDGLGKAIVDRIERLFVAATLQTVVDVEQLRAKLETTKELIEKLDKSVIAEISRDAKGGDLGSDDQTGFSTGVDPEVVIEASQSEN